MNDKWSTEKWGKNAVTGLLGGFIIAKAYPILFLEMIGQVIALAGLVCGIVWIYKKVKDSIDSKKAVEAVSK